MQLRLRRLSGEDSGVADGGADFAGMQCNPGASVQSRSKCSPAIMMMTVRDANLLFIRFFLLFLPLQSDVLTTDNCNAVCKVRYAGVPEIERDTMDINGFIMLD